MTHAGYCNYWGSEFGLGGPCDCGYTERLEERVATVEATIARLVEQDETHFIDAKPEETIRP